MAEEEKKDAKPAEGGAAAAPAEGEAAPAPAEGGGKKKKMLLIASAALAVIGIVVAVGVVFLMGGEKKHENKVESAVQATMIDVPEFTVNLLTESDAGQHFMKIRLAVEIARKEDEVTVNTLLPRLQDDWGGFMRQMRPTDMQGSAALQRLKEGLLRRANQSLSPVAVKAVYIRELLVQ